MPRKRTSRQLVTYKFNCNTRNGKEQFEVEFDKNKFSIEQKRIAKHLEQKAQKTIEDVSAIAERKVLIKLLKESDKYKALVKQLNICRIYDVRLHDKEVNASLAIVKEDLSTLLHEFILVCSNMAMCYYLTFEINTCEDAFTIRRRLSYYILFMVLWQCLPLLIGVKWVSVIKTRAFWRSLLVAIWSVIMLMPIVFIIVCQTPILNDHYANTCNKYLNIYKKYI